MGETDIFSYRREYREHERPIICETESKRERERDREREKSTRHERDWRDKRDKD